MSKKYEDLTDHIADRYGISRTEVSITLCHLDIFPDQVPGRTKPALTRGQYDDATRDLNEAYKMIFAYALRVAGVEVIPAPKPTNAENLKTVLADLNRGFLGYSLDNLVRTLDEAGVTAPDHD